MHSLLRYALQGIIGFLILVSCVVLGGLFADFLMGGKEGWHTVVGFLAGTLLYASQFLLMDE